MTYEDYFLALSLGRMTGDDIRNLPNEEIYNFRGYNCHSFFDFES